MSSQELRFPMAWGHVAAKAWGSSNDKHVLLVHGLLDNAGSFDRLINLLPTGYYFVCIDLPGHGLSSHFPGGVALDYFNYVLVIRKVLDCLKWKTCIYIGHSLGASLGTMFSSIYPDRVIKILCLDAIIAAPIPDDKLIGHIRTVHDNTLNIREEKTVKLYTEEEIKFVLMNLRYSALNIPAAEALIKRAVTKVGNKYKLNRDLRLNNMLFPVLNQEQHFIILKHIQAPTTVVFTTSTLSTSYAKEILKLKTEMSALKKYSFKLVEGNHDVHNNHPERVAPLVTQFLADLKSNL